MQPQGFQNAPQGAPGPAASAPKPAASAPKPKGKPIPLLYTGTGGGLLGVVLGFLLLGGGSAKAGGGSGAKQATNITNNPQWDAAAKTQVASLDAGVKTGLIPPVAAPTDAGLPTIAPVGIVIYDAAVPDARPVSSFIVLKIEPEELRSEVQVFANGDEILGAFSIDVPMVEPKVKLEVVVRADGYQPWKKKLVVKESRSIRVVMRKKGKGGGKSGPGGSLNL